MPLYEAGKLLYNEFDTKMGGVAVNCMKCGRENIQGRVIIFVMTALLFLWSSGCTEYERSGYSAIPQNSPAGWELAPYGDLRN